MGFGAEDVPGTLHALLGTDPFGMPADYGLATAHLIAKCSVINVDMTKMAPGAAAYCPGSLRFRAPDGPWYRFSFQPDNFSGVDRFQVTCTQGDGAGCKVWSIAPSGTTLTATIRTPRAATRFSRSTKGGASLLSGATTTCRSRSSSPADMRRASSGSSVEMKEW